MSADVERTLELIDDRFSAELLSHKERIDELREHIDELFADLHEQPDALSRGQLLQRREAIQARISHVLDLYWLGRYHEAITASRVVEHVADVVDDDDELQFWQQVLYLPVVEHSLKVLAPESRRLSDALPGDDDA
jgi:hypothetical protein